MTPNPKSAIFAVSAAIFSVVLYGFAGAAALIPAAICAALWLAAAHIEKQKIV